MHVIRSAVVLFVSLIMILLFQWPDDKLHVVFCDVGQGDSALIIKGKFQAVIDTGPSIDKFDKCFSEHVPFWDRKIEAVFITHDHDDHAGALLEIGTRYKIVNIFDNSKKNDLLRYGNLYIDTLSEVEAEGAMNNMEVNSENEGSAVYRLSYDNFSALFTGDLEEDGELALTHTGVLNKVNVLKVAHHGSKFGSTDIFLEAVRPEVAIISVGAKNTYGHPSRDALIRLDIVVAKVFRTDELGSIEVVTDGKGYSMRYKK